MSDAPTLTPDLTDPALSDAEVATRLVRRAGALAARMRAEGLTADTKTSITDVVTAADHAAEELVTSALLAARPDDGILGEEGARHTSRSGRTWVIDPVDGTYNFLSGLPTWCSALALAVDGETALGAVHQPSIDETWVGGLGHPTIFDGRALEPLADLPLGEVALATYLHPASMDRTGVRERWLRVVEGAATVRMLGSGSCELAAVAAGRAVILQAANTGLTGGSTPWGDDYDREIVLVSLRRLKGVHLIDGGRQVVGYPVPEAAAEVLPVAQVEHAGELRDQRHAARGEPVRHQAQHRDEGDGVAQSDDRARGKGQRE